MFTTYIDDSGSDPNQKVVVAAGLVIPAVKIVRLESEWNRFLAKEDLDEFHTSECLARNPKTAYADWDDARVKRVFARVGQITLKYASRAFCILIEKSLYDEEMPDDMRQRVGSYYTWAISSVLGLADDFARGRSAPMEYVIDNTDKKTQREIDESIAYSESRFPGHYAFAGHYSFRKRQEVPALQAADFFAWNCFQQGRRARLGHSIDVLAKEAWATFANAQPDKWAEVQSLNREGIRRWVKDNYGGPEDMALKKFKDEAMAARMPKPKRRPHEPRS